MAPQTKTDTSAELLSPDILATVDDLELLARVTVDGLLSGRHRSRRRGPGGGAFAQYRHYVPGDDLRHVDWKQYARSERLNVKLYDEETDMRLAVILDATASMAYRGTRAPWSKFRFGCALAACLACLACRQGDRPGVFLYGGGPGVERCVASGPQHVMGPLAAMLSRRRPDGSGHLQDALDAAGEFIGSRGFVVLLSDLHDEERALAPLMRTLRNGRRDALVLQILDDDELELPFGEGVRFLDSETGEEVLASVPVIREEYGVAMRRFVSSVQEEGLSAQADTLLATTSTPPGALLAGYLRRREAHLTC